MNRIRRNTRILALIIGVSVALLLTGQALRGNRAATSAKGLPLMEQERSKETPHQKIHAFVVRRPTRSVSGTAEHMRLVAEIFVRQPVLAAPIRNALANSGVDRDEWLRPFSEMPDLAVRYDANFDELNLINLELSNTTPNADSVADIGEESAREAMKSHFAELANSGVIRAEDFDLEKVRVAYTRSGGGEIGSSERKMWIEEYRFTLLRQLNGIDFANAGITFGIHRSGGLSSLRLGGVEVESVRHDRVEVPSGRGRVLERQVPGSMIEKRFRAQIPVGAQVRIHQEGLMYVMPDNVKEAVIEPVHIYSFSTSFEVQGQRMVSRRQTIGYSVTDPNASPIDFAAPSSPSTDSRPHEPKRVR